MNQTKPKQIIAFGELLWDVFPTGEVLGGAPANFAYRINSLGHETHLISRVGRDERGERAARLLTEKNLSTQNIQRDDRLPTGSVPISIKPDGSHEFTILPNVAYDHIELTPTLLNLAQTADAICFGTLVQRSQTSRATLYHLLDNSPALKILDLNLRKNCYDAFTIEASLKRADILKLNEDEALYLGRTYGLEPATFISAAVKKWDLDCCIVTLGANGAEAASPSEGTWVWGAELAGAVVDTVGCGDAFTAGFLHHYLAGAELGEACEAANLLAAKVSRTRGGMSPVEP
jgi:fructokinase